MRHKSWWLLVLPALLLLGLAGWMVKGQEKREFLPVEKPGFSMGISMGGQRPEAEEKIQIELETEAVPETESQTPGTRLLFGGDVLLSDHVLNAYDRAGGIHGVVDEAVRAETGGADIFMVNQEFPFSERGTAAEDKEFTFRLPYSRIPILKELGIDIVTLANNHALDYGREALLDTCQALDGAGILRAGAGADGEEAGRPVIVKKNGTVFGFLGLTRVIPESSWIAGPGVPGMAASYDSVLPRALEQIRAAKELCDYLVVYVHWGVERETQPEDYQRSLGQKYIDAGADLVVGSHPHVLQGIEYYNRKPIVYSMGNFVFGSVIPQTMLLEVTVPEGGAPAGEEPKDSIRLRLIPCTSSAGYTTMETNPEDVQAFYREMEAMSFGISVDDSGYVIP